MTIVLRILTLLLLPGLAGWLLAQGLAPTGWRGMSLAAPALLLIALQGRPLKQAGWAGLIFGFVAFLFAFPWLRDLFGTAAYALMAIHALFFKFFGMAHALIERRDWKPWLKVVSFASVWTLLEFIRAEHFWLDFPWLTLGHVMGVRDGYALLPYVGVYGVGFACMLVMAGLLRKARVLALLTILVAALAWRSPPSAELSGEGIPVFGVQAESVTIEHYVKQSKAAPQGTQVIVWPEHALSYDVKPGSRDEKMIKDLAAEKKSLVIFGGHRSIGTGLGWWNSAVTMDAERIVGEHAKNHPVHLFDDGVPGTEALPVITPLGKIGTPVCYDCDYSDVVRRMTAAGAECFIVPFMDAGHWGPLQQAQHAELFRLRAAENGRWSFTCGTSGISQLINPRGQTIRQSRAVSQATLSGTVQRLSHLTFYTRVGWLFPWVASGMGIIALGLAMRRPPPKAANPQ